MIQIGCTERELPADVLRAPGGFLWWYVDLVAPGGDGAVLIWSYGLPFLPGYAAAARRGAPERPVDRPSVNLAVYRGGEPAFYLLQEHPPHDANRAGDSEQRIGQCSFVRRVEGERLTLDAALDCALPGTSERLTGTLRVEGAAREPSVVVAPEEAHVWTPLTGPARGELALAVGGRPLPAVRGRAYHDRNAGRVPLHELGIGRWMWGRFPLRESERVYYLLWPADGGRPVALGMEIGADGRTREVELEVETVGERRAFGGLVRPDTLLLRAEGRPWLSVRHRAVVDAGPFYLRLLSIGTAPGGEAAEGWGELCEPDRVDLPLHRPFVRMRVHRAHGPNSVWLPLFTGPRGGRAGRLLRHLAGGAAG